MNKKEQIDSKWVGKKLRSLRMSKQLSQEAVASDLNLSLTGYANIELGKTNIPFDRLAEILSYFNVPVPHFFYPYNELIAEGTSDNEKAFNSSTISQLEKEIFYLKQIIAEKDKVIALLEK